MTALLYTLDATSTRSPAIIPRTNFFDNFTEQAGTQLFTSPLMGRPAIISQFNSERDDLLQKTVGQNYTDFIDSELEKRVEGFSATKSKLTFNRQTVLEDVLPVNDDYNDLQNLRDEYASQIIEDYRKQNPDFNGVLSDKEIRQQAIDLTNVKEDEAALMLAGASPFTQIAAPLAGGLASSFVDPINLLTLPFGAGVGMSIGRTMLVEGGINMAAELAATPAYMAWANERGREYGLGDAAINVAAGGLFGAGISGAIKGAPKLYSKLTHAAEGGIERSNVVFSKLAESENLPQSVRNTAKFLQRMTEIDEKVPNGFLSDLGVVPYELRQDIRATSSLTSLAPTEYEVTLNRKALGEAAQAFELGREPIFTKEVDALVNYDMVPFYRKADTVIEQMSERGDITAKLTEIDIKISELQRTVKAEFENPIMTQESRELVKKSKQRISKLQTEKRKVTGSVDRNSPQQVQRVLKYKKPPKSLLTRIKEMGGISTGLLRQEAGVRKGRQQSLKYSNSDLVRALNENKTLINTLVKENGLGLDDLARQLADDGYISGKVGYSADAADDLEATGQDLLDLIEREAGGEKVYSQDVETALNNYYAASEKNTGSDLGDLAGVEVGDTLDIVAEKIARYYRENELPMTRLDELTDDALDLGILQSIQENLGSGEKMLLSFENENDTAILREYGILDEDGNIDNAGLSRLIEESLKKEVIAFNVDRGNTAFHKNVDQITTDMEAQLVKSGIGEADAAAQAGLFNAYLKATDKQFMNDADIQAFLLERAKVIKLVKEINYVSDRDTITNSYKEGVAEFSTGDFEATAGQQRGSEPSAVGAKNGRDDAPQQLNKVQELRYTINEDGTYNLKAGDKTFENIPANKLVDYLDEKVAARISSADFEAKRASKLKEQLYAKTRLGEDVTKIKEALTNPERVLKGEYTIKSPSEKPLANQVIEGFSEKNLDNLLSKSGEFFLETNRMLVERFGDKLPAGFKENWDTVMAAIKVDDGVITPASLNKFNKMFKSYLSTEKAPTSALQRIFENFRNWLTKVYQDINKLGGRVSPEMKKVFDDMLTLDDLQQSAMNGRVAEIPSDAGYSFLDSMAKDGASQLNVGAFDANFSRMVDDFPNERVLMDDGRELSYAEIMAEYHREDGIASAIRTCGIG